MRLSKCRHIAVATGLESERNRSQLEVLWTTLIPHNLRKILCIYFTMWGWDNFFWCAYRLSQKSWHPKKLLLHMFSFSLSLEVFYSYIHPKVSTVGTAAMEVDILDKATPKVHFNGAIPIKRARTELTSTESESQLRRRKEAQKAYGRGRKIPCEHL